MEFIFEEEADDVGSDIEAYCPKCKADTSHTVITKYEEEVRRVQCSPCGDVHSYRKPRGEVEDDIQEPLAAKKRAALKKPTWEDARARTSEKELGRAKTYSIRDRYREGEILSHPKFGFGFVSEISENKAEITFQDERRVLVHNRPDLAAQMPAIAGDGGDGKKSKLLKTKGKVASLPLPAQGKGKAAAAPLPVVPPAKAVGKLAKPVPVAKSAKPVPVPVAKSAKPVPVAKSAKLSVKPAPRAKAMPSVKTAAKPTKKVPAKPTKKVPAKPTKKVPAKLAKKVPAKLAKKPAAKPLVKARPAAKKRGANGKKR